nr:MAG TPA: hypothetical protein [Caudoviricetes sp.]
MKVRLCKNKGQILKKDALQSCESEKRVIPIYILGITLLNYNLLS